mmetsp:Transcript_44663/g.83874  ORF Transcript_44663/g.83874 Transcript_44663/m.83874 type:complete len:330 (+) Transcript_44663:67-1056(+)
MPNRIDPADDLRLELECEARMPTQETPNYSLADQTIIFFDWDDTLFPTTQLFDRWGLRASADYLCALSREEEQDLQEWRDALFDLLKKSCMLASKCIILTNSQRPWVQNCIDCFAPDLKQLFDEYEGLETVYAKEYAPGKLHSARSMAPVLRKVASEEEFVVEQTFTKYVAMKSKVKEFYSRYAGQTWKNVLSFGDMPYEYHAMQDVTFHRVAPRWKQETVRTKCFMLPSGPSLSELALRLQFHEKVLVVYVHFDGDLRLDLTTEADPLDAIADAVGVPELSPCFPHSPLSLTSPLSLHQWGIGPKPQKMEIQHELATVEMIVSTIVSI